MRSKYKKFYFLLTILIICFQFKNRVYTANFDKREFEDAKNLFIKYLKEQNVLKDFRNYSVILIHTNIKIAPYFMFDLRTDPILQPQKAYTAVVGKGEILKGAKGFSVLMKAIGFPRVKTLTANDLIYVDETIESVKIPIIWEPQRYMKLNRSIRKPEISFQPNGYAKLVYWYTPLSIGTPMKRVILISINGNVTFNTDYR